MYAMYPDPATSHRPDRGESEWGPARHDPESRYCTDRVEDALQRALDLRDGGAQLPDDN